MTPSPRFAAIVLAAALTAGSALAAQAPAPVPSRAPQPVSRAQETTPASPSSIRTVSDDDAERTRERLRLILRQHPPSLADVLRLDPSLLSSDAYLASYPDLAAFLAQHSEVAHNPGFFVGSPRSEWQQTTPPQAGARAVQQMFDSLMVFAGLAILMGLVGWALKTLVEHRRWLRMSLVQTEAHTKVLDRLASNEDLLAYIQTPAGSRFLESAPIPLEGPRSISAPIGRILFSAQAGTVVTFLGVGLLYVSARLAGNPNINDAAPIVYTMGVVTIAIGVGLLTSSVLAYVLSRRLGLLDAPASSHA
jgi:hypothetical protein